MKRTRKPREDHDYELFPTDKEQKRRFRRRDDVVSLLPIPVRRSNMLAQQDTGRLPKKPKRKYKFVGTAARAEVEDVNKYDFKVVGYSQHWDFDRFMADIEGNWD